MILQNAISLVHLMHETAYNDNETGCRIFINLLMNSVPHHIDTSQLICNAKQLTGFYMMGNIVRL